MSINSLTAVGVGSPSISGTLSPASSSDFVFFVPDEANSIPSGWTDLGGVGVYGKQLSSITPFNVSTTVGGFGVPSNAWANIVATVATNNPVSVVQTHSFAAPGGAGHYTGSFANPITPGNTVVVFAEIAAPSFSLPTFTFSDGVNTYTKISVSQFASPTYVVGAYLWIGFKVAAGTPTLSMTASTSFPSSFALEMAGLTELTGFCFGNMLF